MQSLSIKYISDEAINLRIMRRSCVYVTREQEYQSRVFGLVFAFAMINCKNNSSLDFLKECCRKFLVTEKKKNISYHKL